MDKMTQSYGVTMADGRVVFWRDQVAGIERGPWQASKDAEALTGVRSWDVACYPMGDDRAPACRVLPLS